MDTLRVIIIYIDIHHVHVDKQRKIDNSPSKMIAINIYRSIQNAIYI